ncbi:tRNA-dependent cyclodipeptide synthase [Synechococcus sp. Tobar12-5m-g]|nr:tRNA-dependent cyclodipeptide synthase [Synechococcus sp. Tobar12-5m-g]
MEEIQDQQAMLGMEFVDSCLLEIDGHQIVIAVISHCKQIDLVDLQNRLKASKITVLTADDIKLILPNHSLGIIAPIGRLYGLNVLFAPELKQFGEISFLGDSPRNVFSMAYVDMVSLSDMKEDIEIPTKPKYHVFVNEVAPEIARGKLASYDSCYLGVSLDNPSFSTAKLIAMTDWIAKRFRSCRVLLGDSLYRLSLLIDNHGLTERQAFVQALHAGGKYINAELPVFDRYLNSCPFEFVYCSDIQQTDSYREYYDIIEDLMKNDTRLVNAVNTFSFQFVQRHLAVDATSISGNDFLQICQQYLIEELAIFSCLFDSNLYPILYPGSLSIFEEIANGEHPNLPDSLRDMIYISLRFKRRKGFHDLTTIKKEESHASITN